jgi:hypothetical protein
MRDSERIHSLDPKDFIGERLLPETILTWLDWADAVWMHDGDPEKPHAELTSDLCSNGFFDCMRVLCLPNVNEILAW